MSRYRDAVTIVQRRCDCDSRGQVFCTQHRALAGLGEHPCVDCLLHPRKPL